MVYTVSCFLTGFQVGVPVADGVLPPRFLDLTPALERFLPVLLLLSPQPVDRHLKESARLTPLPVQQKRVCSSDKHGEQKWRGGAERGGAGLAMRVFSRGSSHPTGTRH